MPSSKRATGKIPHIPGMGLRFQRRLDDHWLLEYRIVRARDGRFLGIEHLTIRLRSGAVLPSGGLTGAVIAQVKVEQVRRHLRRILAPPVQSQHVGQGPGRPATLTSLYKRVARRYQDLHDAGEVNIPKQLAHEFKKNRSTMRSLLRRAERLGLFARKGTPS